jgi:hypothetical protein
MLPFGIGPHEGIEFDLMRAGRKNVSMFTDYMPPNAEKIIQRDGLLKVRIERDYKGKVFFTTIVYRHGFDMWANELADIIRSNPISFDVARERRIGELLSYSDFEIEAYISFHLSRI